MAREPIEQWEQILDGDLLRYLIPAGPLRTAWQPADVNQLPAGAHADLAAGIGRHRVEDLLVVPGAAPIHDRLRRRCLYSPLCVLGVGERAAALWVQALPAPGIRAMVSLSEIAAIARRTAGTREQLLVTGRTGRLPLRYDADAAFVVDGWIRRLRRRAAGDPVSVPAGYPVARIVSHGRGLFNPDALRLDRDDDIAASGRYGRAGRRTCLLAVTPRELVVLRSARSVRRPGRITDFLYVPRCAIEDGGVQSGTLLLRSAGLNLRIRLRSGTTAAAASTWLGQVLSEHDRSGTS